jgi:zinc protease
MVVRTAAPRIKDPVEFDIKLPPAQRHKLSNGVDVFAVDMGTEDTIMINWVFNAGNAFEEKKAVAAATNQLLKNGTSTRSAFELNEHFEYHGAYLNRSCYNETAEVSVHCLSKHLNVLLPAVADIFSNSVFPEKEIEIYAQNARQRLKVSLQKSEFVASRLIDAYLFGEQHPYGKYNELDDYSAITQSDLLSFYDTNYRKGHVVMFIAGKLPEGIIEELDRVFGSLPWSSLQSDIRNIAYPKARNPKRKHLVVNDEQGVQAAIRIAREFPNRHHPDFQKALILNNIFGGYFGSRLMANIREDKGYTYGIHSYIMNLVKETGWLISTEAGRDVSEATVKEIYNEMEQLREEEIDEEELHITKNYMIGTILGELDGPFQVAGRWKNLVLNGLDENYFYKGIQTIKTVTAEELRALADKYFDPAEFIEVVVV